MIMANKFAAVALIFMTPLMSAHAQTYCWGINCGMGDGLGNDVPDLNQLYSDLAVLDTFNASQTFQGLYGGGSWSTVSQCVASCNASHDVNKAACFEVNGYPRMDEDPHVTEQRSNCLNAMRQVHIQCLEPLPLMACD